MTQVKWDFPELNGGQEQGYTNSGIETFKGTELIDNLAREICQNSLDAKDKTSNAPVVVKFRLKTFKKNSFPLFSEYLEYIEGCKKFWQSKEDKKVKVFIERVFSVLDNDEINVLVASDYNTMGLTGSEAMCHESSVWRALVNADGVSAKGDNAGGSYGIGKNAPFACSDLSIVFYNTYAKDDKEAFEGVARAATLFNKSEKPTQSIGHYRCENTYKPIIPEVPCTFRDQFKRVEYGTDLIIMGCDNLISDKKWYEKLEQAVLRNFFLAIYENKLIIEIEDSRIDADNIKNYIDKYRLSNKESILTAQFFDTIAEPDGGERRETILDEEDLSIYLKSDKDYKRKIAKFRSSGMLVGTDSCRMMQNFNAIVVVRGQRLDELLRKTEPPKHNQWDYKRIEDDKEKRKEAQQVIKIINEKVRSLINENYKIITEDTIDSELGEYLPDEIDDLSTKKSGDDKLCPIQKIFDVPKKKETKVDTIINTAAKDFGIIDENQEEAEVRNEGKNPKPYPTPKIPNLVKEDESQKDEGVKENEGIKSIISEPKLKFQRIFPKNYKLGLYQINIYPEAHCDNLYIDFSVIGEDNRKEKLNVIQYCIQRQKFKGNNSKIGPISIEPNVLQEIFVTFKNKEKMLINMELTEEFKR